MPSSAPFRTGLHPSRDPADKRPPHPVAQAWTACFGDALPAGFLCRESSLRDRWLRIHSLPESKRYPGDDEELAEVLRRQNTVADELLGDGAACQLFFTRWPDGTGTPRWDRDEPGLDDHGATPALVLTVDESNEHDAMAFFALPVTWRRGAFDRLIADCANDRTGSLLFANLQRGTLYAPYDGGADLFYASADEVDAARTRHQDWLSIHPSGR